MSPRCDHLIDIFTAGVKRVDPYALVCESVSLVDSRLTIGHHGDQKVFNLDDWDNLIVIGAGKATAPMALAIEHICGDKISSGCIVVKYGHTEALQHIQVLESGHPIPDENGVKGAREVLAQCTAAGERTLVVNLISGGGSALLPLPGRHQVSGQEIAFSLLDKQTATQLLLECGATINEINCIRKHMSGIKGGQLARAIAPATSVSLILSDVVGDSLDAIASGPTVPDPTSYADVGAILDKYRLADKMPAKLLELVRFGQAGIVPETPKPGDPLFTNSTNLLIGTNFLSLHAAARQARQLGYTPVILSSQITGEAREVAKVFYGIGKDARKHRLLGEGDLCIIAGGETTVTLRGAGKGGRNQEMALAFLAEIAACPEDAEGLFFLSAATDGNDGPTDAAGACVHGGLLTLAQAAAGNIDTYLNDNNAYTFFDQLGVLFKTGPTNTNVCDLQLMLVTG